MATFSAPPGYNVLGELVAVCGMELDGEVSQDELINWINLELGSICAKREWTFFFKHDTIELGIMDTTTKESIAYAPLHTKKIYEIITVDSAVTADAEERVNVMYEEGPGYEKEWDNDLHQWKLVFRGLGNTEPVTLKIKYYIEPTRLYSETDETLIPTRFTNVIQLAVTKRAYKKLRDMQEYIVTDRDYATRLQEMIDDDAREPDLPKQMSPNRGMSRDEYGQMFENQARGEPIYQRYT